MKSNNNYKKVYITLQLSETSNKLLSISAERSNRKKISPDDFAYIIEDESMSPIYSRGDIAIFSKDKQGECDFVLISIKATGEYLFRKMGVHNNTYTFSPTNSDWPHIQFESQTMFQVLGWIKNGNKVFY